MFVWRRGTVTDLGTLGGPNTGVLDQRIAPADKLNERGQVAGTSETASGALHAFLWSDGRMQDLGTLGGTESRAYGINDRGEVVGESLTASGETHAFLWRDGAMIDLGTILGERVQSYAVAINNRGQVVGVRSFAGQYESYAVLWET
jgi:probable HAF family extracellular repeat protein